eukprot:PhM_4_TR18444/c0_g2_i13/m.72831/K16535/FOPNL, FOR20; lisH domain-containing protein FOPNL
MSTSTAQLQSLKKMLEETGDLPRLQSLMRDAVFGDNVNAPARHRATTTTTASSTDYSQEEEVNDIICEYLSYVGYDHTKDVYLLESGSRTSFSVVGGVDDGCDENNSKNRDHELADVEEYVDECVMESDVPLQLAELVFGNE